MTFYWYDDALRLALELAAGTQMPHRVFQTAGGWTVELAPRAVLEVCS